MPRKKREADTSDSERIRKALTASRTPLTKAELLKKAKVNEISFTKAMTVLKERLSEKGMTVKSAQTTVDGKTQWRYSIVKADNNASALRERMLSGVVKHTAYEE